MRTRSLVIRHQDVPSLRDPAPGGVDLCTLEPLPPPHLACNPEQGLGQAAARARLSGRPRPRRSLKNAARIGSSMRGPRPRPRATSSGAELPGRRPGRCRDGPRTPSCASRAWTEKQRHRAAGVRGQCRQQGGRRGQHGDPHRSPVRDELFIHVSYLRL